MYFIRKNVRFIALFLVLLNVYYASQPLVSFLQTQLEIQNELRITEYLKDENNQIKENEKYVDPKVKPQDRLSLKPLEQIESEYALGTGVDVFEPLAPAGDELEPTVFDRELNLGELKELNRETAKIQNSKSVEYVSPKGTKIIEQSLVDKYKEVDGKFIERDLSIKKDKENYISDSEELIVNYPNQILDGVKVSVPEGELKFSPINANNVEPEVIENTITYKEVWENVNITYEYGGSVLKEYIYINNFIKEPTFVFDVEGATLSYSQEYKGVIEANFKEGKVYLSPLTAYANKIGPVDKQILTQEIINETQIKVSLDVDWLNSLSEDNFPVVIDPIVYREIEGGNVSYTAYKTGGYNCNYTACNVNIGSVQHDSADWYWRTNTNFDLSGLSGKQIIQANLFVEMSYDGRQNGSTSTNVNVKATWANCSGYNCIGSGPTASSSMTTYANVNVKDLLQWMVDNNKLNDNIMLWGDEGSSYTYKGLNPYTMELGIEYNTAPNNNATLAYPTHEQVITNPNQILKINAATDPDGDILYYNFVLKNSTGTIIQQSGFSPSLSMPIADGVLLDEQKYTWEVYVSDGHYTHSSYAFSKTFTMDTRSGKDITQSYDEAGPFAVSLATGNSYTANSSHSISALGGNIGIGLEYNSPFLTKEGLSARYWNNTNMSGNPVYSRIESIVDYDWNTASPIPNVVDQDNFSASWKGYYIVPTTGNYKFGANYDDNIWIYGNNSLILSATCCGQAWSNTIALNAGDVYPIQMDMVELSAGAKAQLLVRLPDNTTKTIPTESLRTAPVASAYNNGLTGKYYFDSGNHNFSTNQSRFLMRNEPVINFNWGTNSPSVGAPSNNFLVRYEGYLTAPPIAGDYKLQTYSDDGVRVSLDDEWVINNWTEHGPTTDNSSTITLGASEKRKIIIEYYEVSGGANLELKWDGPHTLGTNFVVVENKYLSPEGNVLPEGWKLTLDANGSIPFESLKVGTNSDVVMLTSDRTEYLYKYKDGGYEPPVNQDGWLVKNTDNTYTFTDTLGSIYIYDALDNSGKYKLRESSSPYDDKNPAGLKYEYSDVGGIIKLRKIIDGVDNSRYGQLYYEGDSECSGSTGDNIIPPGYLCGFKTTDDKWTRFHYYLGKLSRIVYPGDAYFDYGYLTDGRITSLRDSGMIDAIVAGLRNSSEQGSAYNFAYDELGRMDEILLPSNTGNSALQHTFEYFPGASKQHIVGAAEPNGYSKYLEFDSKYRTTELCDAMALCSTTEWDTNKDLVLSTTGPTGLKSTTIYDADDRPLEAYGPAPASWFGGDRKPTSTYINQVPKVETKYDENFTGPSVAFYQVKNSTLFGSPKLHQFGIDKTNPSTIAFNYSTQTFPITKETGMDGVGLSMSGKITFPSTGTYTFKSVNTDGVRLYVDDKLIVDNWTNRSGSTIQTSNTFAAESGKVYRVRLDWATFNATPQLSVLLSGPGISETNVWSSLKPGFNLPTTNIVYDQQLGNIETNTTYQDPAYGLVSSKVLDPSGLNYSSSATYEQQGTGYFRQLSKTSVGGSTTKYQYYGANEQVDNVCTIEVDPVSQAGFVRTKIEPSVLSRDINVIPNPSFEMESSGSPSNWTSDTYGTNTATFNYSTTSYSGAKSAHVNVISYTSGDSKWYSDEGAIKPNTTYKFKEFYKSTTGTEVLLRFTTAPSTYTWVYLGALPSSGNIWTSFEYNFTSPANATHVSTFHVVNGVGELWMDDVSVAEISPYNLVLNPSVEASNSGNPYNWYSNAWGTNTATFTYVNDAADGTKGLKASISGYVNGEAKWSHDEVAVTPDSTYSFTSSYKSTANSSIVIAYKLTNSTYQYIEYATLSPSANWTNYSANIPVPSNVTHMFVMHMLRANGDLYIDNYSIKKAAPQNRILNPSAEASTSSNPNNWYSNSWGNNTATFNYVNDAADGTKGLKASISGYVDGEAKWVHDEVAVTAGEKYEFKSSYKSNVNTAIVVAYKTGSSTYTYEQLPSIPLNLNWSEYSTVIEIPSGVTHIMVMHMLRANGDLWVDNYSLKQLEDNFSEGIKTEVIYDKSGRVVASRINKEDWNCTNYDDRGRVESKVIATNNGKTGKTVTNNFAYGDSPLKRSVTDGTTTVISEYDFVGNLIRYVDSSGMETTYTYDSLNRLIKKESDIGKEEWTYNDYNQVTSKELDDVVMANVTYDSYGRVDGITYPQASQLEYLGTTRDSLDRPIKYSWKQSDGTLIDEELVKSQSGLVLEQEFTQGSTTYTQEYTFDKADRLIAADYGDRQYAYSYAAASNCNFTNSNKNFNRTSDIVTVSGVTTTNNYCYDNADKLVTSTQYGTPQYDSHGNTTKLGGTTFTYDVSDQNIGVSESGKSITYARDVMGRITNSNYNSGSDIKKYSFTSSTTSTDILRDGSNNIIEKYVSLPGMLLTIKTAGNDYSIMSSTGNVLANNTGTLKRYDPFGVPITAVEKFGFGGTERREVENRFSILFTQMGARVYIPALGRFLQVDPVEGGTQNDYVYPNDPINSADHDGNLAFMAVIGAAFLIMEVIDWIDTASQARDCLDGSSEGCINTAVNAGLSLLPGPSLKWLDRGLSSLAHIKKVDNIVSSVKVADKVDTYVYKGFDKISGELKYVGISSKPDIRFKQHGNSRDLVKRNLNYQVVSDSMTRSQARVIEQNFINQYGLKKSGGQLINIINSIAPSKWANCGVLMSCKL